MTLITIQFMFVLGIIGHALNMYCDRILSIFPNGRIMLGNIKEIQKDGVLAHLLDRVSADVPMRSAVWGVFAIVLEFFSYFALSIYTYGYSHVLGLIVYIICLIIAVVTGVIGFPVWAVVFTILPVAVLIFPFKIIGTLHIASMISMFAWIFLV